MSHDMSHDMMSHVLYCRLINPAIKLFNGLSIIGSCHLSNNGIDLSKEPYTTEDLSIIKGGVVLLTAPIECMKFNFSNPKASTS